MERMALGGRPGNRPTEPSIAHPGTTQENAVKSANTHGFPKGLRRTHGSLQVSSNSEGQGGHLRRTIKKWLKRRRAFGCS